MFKLPAAGVLAAYLIFALTLPAAAQSADPFQKLFGSSNVDATALSTSFLSQISVEQLQTIVNDWRAQLGTYVESSGTPSDTTLRFTKGFARAKYSLDPSSRFLSVLFYAMQNDAATGLLTKLLTTGKVDAADFDPHFLAQIPAATLESGLAQAKAQYGDFISLEPREGIYGVKLAKSAMTAMIALSVAGKIIGFRMVPEVPKASSMDDALRKLTLLKGSLSYVILEGRTERAALNADTPLSIGSAFKLAVLATLRGEIAAKKRHWDDVVVLRAGDKSLPSGRLQDWPTGTHLTLETLATLMISISDNTATDVLIHTLGRAAIEPNAYGNAPLLTTRNMFALKSSGAAQLRDRWRKGDLAQRRALLAELDARPIGQIAQADIQPADLDIEWQFSVRQLCTLMARVADLPLMWVNPGYALATDWKRVAFKGGSDGGVINLTTMLTTTQGKSYCVSATLNDRNAEVDKTGLGAAYSALLDQLKGEAAGNGG